MNSLDVYGKRVFLAGSYPYLSVSEGEYRKAADCLKSLGAEEVRSVLDLKPLPSTEDITAALLREILRYDEYERTEYDVSTLLHYDVVALLPNWSTTKYCNALVIAADALGIPTFNLSEIQRAAMLKFWQDA